jgi:hypothetical protein
VCSQGLFNDPGTFPWPPLRDINHKILLIDETKIYPWQPSHCPEVFKEQWVRKKRQHLDTWRWRVTTARNTVPLLCIPTPNKPKDKPELCTTIDLRVRNSNTYKMSALLPSIEGVLWRAAQCPYWSPFDQKDTYEQIWIKPEHVSHTAVTTPVGNIESLVLQIGDTNGPATFECLWITCFQHILAFLWMSILMTSLCTWNH